MFKVCVMMLALGACIPVVVPVPIGVQPQQARMISTQAPTDVGFDQSLAALRKQAGAPALTYNGQLERASRAHAADMIARGYFSHTSPDGAGPGVRAQSVGVPVCGVAENIAKGQKTSAAAFESWLNSGPHRKNLLNRQMVSYGLGQSGDAWVMML